MASFRAVVTLVLALTLCFAASAAAQALGPICLVPTVGGETFAPFVIFALPMGSAQFLLSAAAGVPYSGAASIRLELDVFFTLVAGSPTPSGTAAAAAVFAGVLNLETGTGAGTCSFIDSTVMELPCGTNTPVTYALVGCDGA